KKPIDSLNVTELDVDIKPRLKVVKTEEPAARESGIKVADVRELVEKLKNEAGVL
ncbi:MAG: electron transfer flavoprotein subunit beta/FixA family protein, partial [Pseudomonadota bacterium]|nr:electron transfer flavoprotein subunit beta/FixA family protein [Pseudomonadota bacterium]